MRFILLTYLLYAVTMSSSVSAEEAFKPMFDGNDLSGWVLTNTPPQTWTFDDNILVCSGKPIGEIRTARMYQNFVMELEWRHMVPRGNAGVFVWADDITARGVPFHRGIEVQVLENEYGNTRSHTTHGDIFPIHGATMTPINGRGGSRAFPTEQRSRPSPQWNHYRIECRDGDISLAVNGKVVTRGKNCVPRKGYICLESEGGVVHYRNVKIRELPSTEIPPEYVAIADSGYRSLYTGLNLDGWQIQQNENGWKPNDWILEHHAEAGETGELVTEESFERFGFVVDIRLKTNESNATISAGDGVTIDLRDRRIAERLEPAESWNRFEFGTDDGQTWLKLNGARMTLQPASTTAKLMRLSLTATGPVDFCNIYALGR